MNRKDAQDMISDRPRGSGVVSPRARGFTLVDVLVTMGVISVLIGLLVPTLGRVNESARRVVCQSNIRQIGLGVIMYADDHGGLMPATRFVQIARPDRGGDEPQRTVALRAADDSEPTAPPTWDGLGALFDHGYISAPRVFYCPSHWGENPYRRYALNWSAAGGEIVCNYHYRGEGPTRPGQAASRFRSTTNALYLIDPAHSSLIADGMEVRSDYNHRQGVNFFRADLTVHWYPDARGELLDELPVDKQDIAAPRIVREMWERFDAWANEPK
jgi:type II secretory pathway pseudopilin PulG